MIQKLFLAMLLMIFLLLCACGPATTGSDVSNSLAETTGVAGSATTGDADSATTGVASSATTAGTDAQNEEAIIKRLGVDYRKNWRPYLMEFDVDTCDYWFIQEGNTYHAFFLVFIKDGEDKGQHIAHATSTDFLNWEYQGIVLRGFGNSWDDRQLATGSVAEFKDTYYMLYTGHSTTSGGMGLAKSKDLYTWERVGDGPVIPSSRRYRGEYEGKQHVCTILADPYIYPKAIDGYYYAYVNSWATDMPKNSRGCQLMFRSANLVNWEPYKIAILTEDLDRLETCQVWEHDGKWYMSFGGRRIDPQGSDFSDVESANYIYMADSFDGPFKKQDWSVLTYPNAGGNPYIQKAISDPFGDQVMLAMAPYKGVLWPYYIQYGKNGGISFSVVYR